MDELDELFERSGGSTSWFDSLTDEQKTWVRAVADREQELGRSVSPTRFIAAFNEQFGGGAPKAPETVRATLKRLRS